MTSLTPPTHRHAAVLVVLLLAAGCSRGRSPGATEPIPPPTRPATAGPTLTPPGPTPLPASAFGVPIETGTFPPDLSVLGPENVDQLSAFRRLPADGLPALVEGASLAFPPGYHFELVAQLDDGQTLVWNMATTELSYRDQRAPATLLLGRNPALAVSQAFQGYLATAARIEGLGTAQAIVVRPPAVDREPFMLSGASDAFDPEQITALAFSPDGHWLAAGMAAQERGLIKIWDIWESDATQLLTEIEFSQPVGAAQFSPDGTTLFAGVGQDLLRLDPTSGRELGRDRSDTTIEGLSLGPSGNALAIWGDQQAVLMSAVRAVPLVVPAVDAIRRVEFSPDERLALLVDGDRLRLWDVAAGTERVALGGSQPLLDAGFHGDGRVLVTIDAQANLLLWGVSAGVELPAERAVISRSNAAQLERAASLYLPGGPEARFTSDSGELIVGGLHGIYLVDLPTLEMRGHLPHGTGSTEFATSPDDRWIAQPIEQGVVRIWNRQQLRPEQEIRVPDEFCCSKLEFTPDGRSLITHTGLGTQVWDLQTGSEVYDRPRSQWVHVSPDGTRLAFQEGLEVNIVQWPGGQALRTLTGFETASPVVGTVFSPTWEVMYWAGRATIQFIDVQSGRLGVAIPFSWGPFSPEGDRLAAVEDGWTMASVGQVHQFDVQSGETLNVFDHQEDAIVDAVAYSPDGNLLATATEFSVRLWDSRSGEQLAALPASAKGIRQLAFSPDRRMLITIGQSDLVELWVVPGAGRSSEQAIGAATAGSVVQLDALQLPAGATDAVFAPDGSELAISTATGEIWYWDQVTGMSAAGDAAHADWIYRLAHSPGGTDLASVSKDGELHLNDTARRWYYQSADDHQGEVSAVAFHPNGRWAATGGEDGMVRFWTPGMRSVLSFQAHSAWVWDLAFSPTGDLLATASADRTVRLWQVRLDPQGLPLVNLARSLTGHTANVYGVDFSRDGSRLASASWDATVRIWNAATGETRSTLRGHTDWVYKVAYSPDGTLLASASADGTVRLWSAVTGEPLATLFGPGAPIWSVAFSSDGLHLVSTSDSGLVQLWGVAR